MKNDLQVESDWVSGMDSIKIVEILVWTEARDADGAERLAEKKKR